MGYELSITNANFQDKLNHWINRYPEIPEFSQPDVKKCAWEMVHHDLYAIADKEKYSPTFVFPANPGYRGFSFPMINCGLLPDPALASTLFGHLQSTLVRIVLFVRSFPFFNSYAKESHELLHLYKRVKKGAATRLALAKKNFSHQEWVFKDPQKWISPAGNGYWLSDLDWKLFSFGETSYQILSIFYLAKKLHDLRGQVRATDNLEALFKDHSNFLTKTVNPLRELMSIRQQLFTEIVEAAEQYPLFGRTKPVVLPSLQKHRQAVEKVVQLIKEYSKANFDQGSQQFYWQYLWDK